MRNYTKEELEAHCRKLWDTQWMNVVNHDNCYRGWAVDEAVNHAVKMAEKYMRENFEAYAATLRQQAALAQGEAVAFLVTDAKGKKFTIYNALLAEAIRKIAKDKGSSLQIDAVCTIPDYGWFCTRGEGHDGPCAAWPNSPTETCPTCGGPATRREVSGAFEMRDEWSHAERARVPECVIELMNHLEVVLSEDQFALISTEKWNAVTMTYAAPSQPEDAA